MRSHPTSEALIGRTLASLQHHNSAVRIASRIDDAHGFLRWSDACEDNTWRYYPRWRISPRNRGSGGKFPFTRSDRRSDLAKSYIHRSRRPDIILNRHVLTKNGTDRWHYCYRTSSQRNRCLCCCHYLVFLEGLGVFAEIGVAGSVRFCSWRWISVRSNWSRSCCNA